MNNARDRVVQLVGRGWDQVKGSLYRNAIFIMLTSVISSGLGFFFWLVIGNAYDKNDVGSAIVLFQTLGFIGTLGSLGIGVGLIRYLPETKDQTALVNAGLTISGVVTLVLSLVFLALLPLVLPNLAFVIAAARRRLPTPLIYDVLGPFQGPPNAAYFYIALIVASLLYITPGSAFTSFYAEASQKNMDRRRGERDAILLSVGLLIPAIAAMWFFSEPMLRLFGDPAYADQAVTPLRILSLASIPVFINGILGTRVRVRKRTLPLIVSATIATVITLGLGFVLLQNPDLGIDGLAYAYVLGQVAAMPYLFYEAREAFDAVPQEPLLGQPLE